MDQIGTALRQAGTEIEHAEPAQIDEAVAKDNSVPKVNYHARWDTQLLQGGCDFLNIVQTSSGQSNDNIVDRVAIVEVGYLIQFIYGALYCNLLARESHETHYSARQHLAIQNRCPHPAGEAIGSNHQNFDYVSDVPAQQLQKYPECDTGDGCQDEQSDGAHGNDEP